MSLPWMTIASEAWCEETGVIAINLRQGISSSREWGGGKWGKSLKLSIQPVRAVPTFFYCLAFRGKGSASLLLRACFLLYDSC